MTIVFSEPVFGFDLSNLNLDLVGDGQGNLLTAAQTLSTSDNVTWTLGNLDGLTNVTGDYTLTLSAGGSTIHDALGNPFGAPVQQSWTRAAWLPGDANTDGKVDLTDFGILKDHFGVGNVWDEGDFNGDGQVDLLDFAILKDNFGKSGAVGAAGSSSASQTVDALTALEAAWAEWGLDDDLNLGQR
jgi:hypothetical protein